jgi:hypothetical protein
MSNAETSAVYAQEIMRLKKENAAQLAELHRISEALGTNEGHSSVTHIEILKEENAALRGQLQKETQRRFDGNEIASKEHREEVAALREELTKCKVALADRDSAWRLYKEAREAEVQQASRADEAVAERDKLVAAFAHLQSFVSGDLQEYDAAEVASMINAALKEEGK